MPAIKILFLLLAGVLLGGCNPATAPVAQAVSESDVSELTLQPAAAASVPFLQSAVGFRQGAAVRTAYIREGFPVNKRLQRIVSSSMEEYDCKNGRIEFNANAWLISGRVKTIAFGVQTALT